MAGCAVAWPLRGVVVCLPSKAHRRGQLDSCRTAARRQCVRCCPSSHAAWQPWPSLGTLRLLLTPALWPCPSLDPCSSSPLYVFLFRTPRAVQRSRSATLFLSTLPFREATFFRWHTLSWQLRLGLRPRRQWHHFARGCGRVLFDLPWRLVGLVVAPRLRKWAWWSRSVCVSGCLWIWRLCPAPSIPSLDCHAWRAP